MRNIAEFVFMLLVVIIILLVILPNVMSMGGMDGFPTLADAITVLR